MYVIIIFFRNEYCIQQFPQFYRNLFWYIFYCYYQSFKMGGFTALFKTTQKKLLWEVVSDFHTAKQFEKSAFQKYFCKINTFVRNQDKVFNLLSRCFLWRFENIFSIDLFYLNTIMIFCKNYHKKGNHLQQMKQFCCYNDFKVVFFYGKNNLYLIFLINLFVVQYQFLVGLFFLANGNCDGFWVYFIYEFFIILQFQFYNNFLLQGRKFLSIVDVYLN
eukprot:TRINITY_DN2367_c0_g3_i1.p3 TRINITY_DN2367_c0_g3~~TRINITY_DN2367_c0_g3_i1.p3  ORF type:complete len:218 (-),score=-1.24 TRINITY_DN2367_c0_g3_i1:477-1130(-)